MILGQVFSPNAININLESSEKDEVFEELIEEFVAVHPEVSRSAVLTALIDREQKLSTGIGRGVAVPHGICGGFSGVKGVIGISRAGIDFDSLDKLPVHIIFMLLSGNESSFIETILSKKTPQDVYDTLVRFEESVTAVL